jgi:hypothetical protein
MAINLWKLGGKPTSYNPLIGEAFASILNANTSYRISFKAKSNSFGILMITDTASNGRDIYQFINLTPYLQTFSYDFTSKHTQNFHFVDTTFSGDIIIEDIQLIEKPLSKLTINGIDGFLSGKWTINANAKVIDDETLELNATGTFQMSELSIQVQGGQAVSFSQDNQSARWDIDEHDKNGSIIVDHGSFTGNKTWTLNPITAVLKVKATNSTIGQHIFRRPMLNLGPIPAPYEKKRGDVMVMPVPKKNLIPFPPTDSTRWVYWSPNIPTVVGDYVRCILDTKKATTVGWNGNGSKFSIVEGKMYILSFTARASRNGVVPNYTYLMGGGIYGANKNLSPAMTSLTTEWKRYEVSVISEITTASANVMLGLTLATGNLDGDWADFKDVQFEEGAIPTSYEPYNVQMNPKPRTKFPKKNLFDGRLEMGVIYGVNGQNGDSTNNIRSVGYTPIKPSTRYTLSDYLNGVLNGASYGITDVTYYDKNLSYISTVVKTSFNNNPTPSNAYYIRFRSATGYTDLSTKVQIEEGSTATAYETYTEVLPPSKKGLVMDGTTNYLQLPSMTMDAIEIDCLIDSVQPNAQPFLFDARNGSVWFLYNGGGIIGTESLLDGKPFVGSYGNIPKDKRVKLRFNNDKSFTDDLTIFSYYDGRKEYRLKGILYGVKCFLNGQVVAEYDFTNPNTIVGDKVLPKGAKNLIPAFDSPRWSLHANARVLGKDVLRLEASAVLQYSDVYIDAKQLTKAQFTMGNAGKIKISGVDKDGIQINAPLDANSTNSATITVPANTDRLRVQLFALTVGSFDFIRPQLYELDGKEGTLYGNPINELKAPKRVLYAKR